jgi:hypothetical protein
MRIAVCAYHVGACSCPCRIAPASPCHHSNTPKTADLLPIPKETQAFEPISPAICALSQRQTQNSETLRLMNFSQPQAYMHSCDSEDADKPNCATENLRYYTFTCSATQPNTAPNHAQHLSQKSLLLESRSQTHTSNRNSAVVMLYTADILPGCVKRFTT